MDAILAWAQRVKPDLVALQQRSGIPAWFACAQFCHESYAPEQPGELCKLARFHANYGGLKYAPWQTEEFGCDAVPFGTWEVYNGDRADLVDGFCSCRDNGGWETWLKVYERLLKMPDLYGPCLAVRSNVYEYAACIAGKGYATNPSYLNEIKYWLEMVRPYYEDTMADISTAPHGSVRNYEVHVDDVTASSATFTWKTNVPATHWVLNGDAWLEGTDKVRTTEHRIVVSNLAPGHPYTFTLLSQIDTAAARTDVNFTTLVGPVLSIHDARVSDITANSATCTWRTNVPATHWVLNGDAWLEGTDKVRTTEHRIVLSKLAPGQTYTFTMMSQIDTEAARVDVTFTTSAESINAEWRAVAPPETVPWEPWEAPIRSDQATRSPELLQAVIGQCHVATASRYRKNLQGKGETYCNIFLWDVTAALNALIPHWVSGGELDANMTVDWLTSQGGQYGWGRADAPTALAYANAGKPSVAVWKNPSGIGHVAVVRPGQADAERGLPIAQAGARNFDNGYLKDGFGSAAGSVSYYVHG